MVERNVKGIELEKKGDLNEAIKLYEMNVKDCFDGNHPNNRLAIIYRKEKQFDDEIRVLKKAIWVFENAVSKERSDREPKLKKFQERLKTAKDLKSKNK